MNTAIQQAVAGLILLCLLLGTIGGYLFLQLQSDNRPLSVGETIPSVKLSAFNGEERNLDSLIRMNTALIFFTTTCMYCLEELRSWKSLFPEFKDTVQLIAVSLSRKQETVQFAATEHLPYPVYIDESVEVRRAFHVTSVPMIYMIDTLKRVQSFAAGKRSEKQLRLLVDQLCRKNP
ncbi:MAG: TlpA disulfide reductase family protein [Bacteroidota bacterium]